MSRTKEPKDTPGKITDADLWAAAMQDTKPLPGQKKKKPPETAAAISVRETALQPRKAAGATAKTGHGIDRNTDEKLRGGKMKIEARLDLHGFRQDEAGEALRKFIQRCHAEGKRCVLVITGKGGQRPAEEKDWWEDKKGILKEAVPRWLREKPLADIVLQVHPARVKDGGEGALYVLLRRGREY